MNLLDIKSYFQTVKITTLANLCTHFQCDADALRLMLSHWMRKGYLRQCMKTPACGVKCMQCSPMTTEIYEWVFAKGTC